MRSVKATNTAEKSGRSKRRRLRGLRRGKARSRGRHPRRSSTVPPTVPKEFSMRNLNRCLQQFDFWENRISIFKKRIADRVKKGYLLWKDQFSQVWFARDRDSYWVLRAHILKGHKAARPLVQTEAKKSHELFVNFLYKEFNWVPPHHNGGIEKFRSEILDDLVRLVRPSHSQPLPSSKNKLRRAHARAARKRRTARDEVLDESASTSSYKRPPCCVKAGCVKGQRHICKKFGNPF